MNKFHTSILVAFRTLVICFALVLPTIYPAVAAAQDAAPKNDVPDTDVRALNEGRPYFDADAEKECTPGGTGTLTLVGDDNEAIVMNFLFIRLTAAGVSAPDAAAQAAGAVGNFIQESNINPASNIPTVTNNPAHGLAQWEAGRWDALQQFVLDQNAATGNSKDVTDLGLQLDFIWFELNGSEKSAFEAFKQTTNPTDAATIWSTRYERPGSPNLPKRIEYANDAYGRHGEALASGTGITAADASTKKCGGGNVSVQGYAFPIAPQTKQDYSTMPCRGEDDPIPGYPARGWDVQYNPQVGPSGVIHTCHHDNSPAFDLMYGPREDYPASAAGAPIFAISDGQMGNMNLNYCNPNSSGDCASYSGQYCNSFNFYSTKDNHNYWYGHVLLSDEFRSASKGFAVAAGTALGTTAFVSYGPMCWGGGPHLHIDRGCYDDNGTPEDISDDNNSWLGGSPSCRDAGFLKLLEDIWMGLPE